MEEHKVPRTGNVPLAFQGEEVASSAGKYHTGQDQNRWHDITVYSTAGGRYVVHIAYRTMWQGEDGHDTVVVCGLIPDIADTLRAYDPLEHVAGYPPAEHFAEKQMRLEDGLRRRWASQVSDVLDALGVTERID